MVWQNALSNLSLLVLVIESAEKHCLSVNTTAYLCGFKINTVMAFV